METNNKTLSMVNIVPLKPYIDRLMVNESDSVAIKSFCDEYTNKLANGQHDEQLCEQFVIDLSKIANTETSKAVLAEVNEAVKKNESNIRIAKSVYQLPNSSCMFVAPMIESAVVNYLIDKNSQTRDDVRVNISLFENEKLINDIFQVLDFESYEEKSGKSLVNAVLKEEFKEQPVPEKKMYTEEEVNAIIADKMNETKTEVKSVHNIPNYINLHSVITKILNENKSNEKLKVFCEQYMNALNEGKSDEELYEAFITGASNWNYLSAVDTELSALKDRVGKYKQDIDLKKILETMKETASYYIVPLIEDVVVDYVNNKSMSNRGILLQRLDNFSYDHFVRDIINVVSRDNSIPNSVYLGESLEMANENFHTENVFSPIQYIKENECVFNVKNSYYVRRGNTVSKLTKNEVASLSESFKTLCNLINSDNIVISKELNSITYYDGENKGVINESAIEVNGQKVVESDLSKLAKQTGFLNEDNYRFYNILKILNENYDNIACIDFVKRVTSNDGKKSVDVFKMKGNIFVNCIDESLGTSTFYRNVNPIQCRNYINEHMEINVSPMFEDILPDQDNVEKGLNDKKKEYEDYISYLEDKKTTLETMKDEGADQEDIQKAIDMIDKEIEDTKVDYKKFQDDADKFMKGDEKDADDSMKDKAPKDADDDNNGDNDETPEGEDNGEKETPEEMEVPIQGEETAEVVDVTETPDEYEGVPDYDGMFDTPHVEDSKEYGFNVVKVSYDKNIKTSKTSGKGSVIVLIPSVDSNGDIHDETRKVSFYLDQDRTPIITNEYMPLDLYMAIKNAIEENPETETVEIGEAPDTVGMDNAVLGLPAETEETPADAGLPVDVAAEIAGDILPTEETTEVPTEETEEVKSEEEVKETPETPIEEPAKETEEISTEEETPAETKEIEDTIVSYPINVGVYPDEISPKEMAEFEDDMDKLNIKHAASEAKDGETILTIDNLAQAHGLKKYFNKWYNYAEGDFVNFFPELKKCFDNKCSTIPVQATNESIYYSEINDPKEWLKWAGRLNSKTERTNIIKEIVAYLNNQCNKHPDTCGDLNYVDSYNNAVPETWERLSQAIYDKYLDSDNESVYATVCAIPRQLIERVCKRIIGEDVAERFLDYVYNTNTNEAFKAIIPCNEAYCKLFGIDYDKDTEVLELIAESEDEAKNIYESLYMYSKKNSNVDQDVLDVLERYQDTYGKLCESECVYNLTLPYNNMLEQKLVAKGFNVNVVNESMTSEILKCDYGKVKGILESFYGENRPSEADGFFQLSENVKIIIKDDKTGKTVEINTDDVEGSKVTENETDFDQAFKDVTFNPESSAMFSDDEESADDEEEEKKEVKEGENTEEEKGEEEKENTETEETEKVEDEDTEDKESEKTEDETGEENTEDTEQNDKKKKTFKFKVTKKSKTDESVKEANGEHLNESEKPEPNVLDLVELPDGKKGQVICQQANGDLIVNVEGHTRICRGKDLKLYAGKFDTLQPPFKYDPLTLKGVYESYVNCGLFINDVQVTPNDCKVQLLEWLTAPDDKEINLIIEGEKAPALKKYIKLTENIDDVVDMANYAEGKMTIIVEGVSQETDVILNIKDYRNYKNVNESNIPVRVLLKDEVGETHLRYIAGGSLRLNESNDVYTPEYEVLVNNAINALS